VPGTILRPGRIGWHSRSGALAADDLVSRAIRACVQLGAAPVMDPVVEMSPVDYVSRAAAAVIRRPDSLGRAFHLANPRPMRLGQLLGWVRAAGYPLEPLPPEEWLRRMQSSATYKDRDAVSALLPLMGATALHAVDDESADAGPFVDDRNTRAALAGTGIDGPAITTESVAVFLARMAAAGLLNPPAAAKMPQNGRSYANGHAAHSRSRLPQGTK
jgi:thioester reductase-like protein